MSERSDRRTPRSPDSPPRQKSFKPRPLPPSARTRAAAAELLMITLDQKRMFDEALSQSERFEQLKGPDRGFARAMASAALRHLGQIDDVLNPLLQRPISTASPGARALLRIGAAQLWCLGTPVHAAVAETVTAASALDGTHNAGGFLNAVLRKANDRKTDFADQPVLNIWPEWLRGAFTDSLGTERAAQFAKASLEIPALDITGAPGRIEEIATDTGGQLLPPETVRIHGAGSPEELPGYDAGLWWVQDRAAQAPVQVMGDVAGQRVLDLCAAPGGKSLQLAARGAHVTALDRSAARLRRLRSNATRTRLLDRITIVEGNAETWRPEAPADLILLDAPCSALGTLRRHPEGAWIKDVSDVTRFPEVQLRLLQAAMEMLSPGGMIVYCVCSPLRAEGRDVVEAALQDSNWVRDPIRPEESSLPERWATPEGDLLTLPDPAQSDGLNDAFFISRIRRAPH